MSADLDPQQNITHATRRAFVEGVRGSRERSEVLGLVGASGAYLLAGLLAASSETLLVVTAGQKEAARLAADLAFCHGHPGEIFLFPHWEIGPYEPLQPHPEVEAERLAALAALHEGRARVLVVPVRALLQKVIPRQVLAGLCERLQVEEEYPRQPLLQRLLELGYQAVPLVEDRGTFSVRGDLLDIYPPTRATPVRIEFFGDYIERMRPFDPASQRSADQELEDLMLLPAREMVLAGEHLETFTRKLKERCDTLGLPRSVREAVIEEAREGILAPGRAFLLPCNYARLDFLSRLRAGGSLGGGRPGGGAPGGGPLRRRDPRRRGPRRPARGTLRRRRRAVSRPRRVGGAAGLATADRVCPAGALPAGAGHPVYRVQAEGNGDLRRSLEGEEGLAPLAERLRAWLAQNWRVLVVCHQRGQAERLADLLGGQGLPAELDPAAGLAQARPGRLLLTVGELGAGFRLPDEHLALIAEEEIFGPRVRRRDRGRGAGQGPALHPRRAARGRLRGPRRPRHRPLPWAAPPGHRADRGGLPACSNTPAEDKLYLPVDRIEKVSEVRRRRGTRATPRQDGRPGLGEGQAQGPGGGGGAGARAAAASTPGGN